MAYQSRTSTAAQTTEPVRLLALAVVYQAVNDTTSANAEIRRDAEKFWQNRAAVQPWAEALDLDVEALAEAVQRLRQA